MQLLLILIFTFLIGGTIRIIEIFVLSGQKINIFITFIIVALYILILIRVKNILAKKDVNFDK